MILDNLSRAFRTQNWFAVATEFVIVIAGVVIGFQINAWNEERAAKAETDRVMMRLRSESEEVVRFWIDNVKDALENDRHRIRLLYALDRGQIEAGTEDAVESGLVGLFIYTAFNPPSTVFDELLASGGLGRISDPRSNAAVSDYADQLTFITSQLEGFRKVTPDGFDDLHARVMSVFDPTTPALRRYEYDIAELSQDRAFVSAIVNGARNQRVFLLFRITALQRANEMCEALSAAQGSVCSASPSGREKLEAARSYIFDKSRRAP